MAKKSTSLPSLPTPPPPAPARPTGLVVNLGSTITLRVVGGKEIKADKLTVLRMIDDPMRKTVTAITDSAIALNLWEGNAYDTIGQWTDDNVKARIIELLTSK